MKRKPIPSKPSVMQMVEDGNVRGLRALVDEGVGLLDQMEDLSPLALAVERGDAKMAKALLDLGHDPNLGVTVVPLAEAAQTDNLNIVELLLERGAAVDAGGEEGETALMLAAGAGLTDMVIQLLKRGASVKARDRSGQDALDYAVKGRHSKLIEHLLPQFSRARQDQVKRQAHLWCETTATSASTTTEPSRPALRRKPKSKPAGPESLIHLFQLGRHKQFLRALAASADPNETDERGVTILGMVTASSSVFELLEPLLRAGADPNRGELRPLNQAAWYGAEPVRALLQAGADVQLRDPDGGTALMVAAGAGDEEAVRLLLNAGVDPNAEDRNGHTAYWHALEGNRESVAALLAPLTADAASARMPWRKNREGKPPEECLIDAARGGDQAHVKLLLKRGVRPNVADPSGQTPLHWAAANGDVKMLRVLHEAGAGLETIGCRDLTPLQAAASGGQTKAVQYLLQAGANVHAGEDDILCYACENQDCVELVELLIRAGASVNAAGGPRGASPLHAATERNDAAVVRRLLANGAEVHAKDPNGWTPFLNAALRADLKVLQLLIDAGSDVSAVDREGRNAYDLASRWGKPEAAKFLRQLLEASR